MNNLTELIHTFPTDRPIVLVVYDHNCVSEAAYEVALVHGVQFLDNNVTFVTYKDSPDLTTIKDLGEVYIDPMVLKYKAQWQD